MHDGHWTYREWVEATVPKIVGLGLATPAENQAEYLNVQIRAAIAQAHRHGRSSKSEDDPVTP